MVRVKVWPNALHTFTCFDRTLRKIVALDLRFGYEVNDTCIVGGYGVKAETWDLAAIRLTLADDCTEVNPLLRTRALTHKLSGKALLDGALSVMREHLR